MKQKAPLILILILIFIEIYISTIKLKYFGGHKTPIIYLATGIGIGLLLLKYGKYKSLPKTITQSHITQYPRPIFNLLNIGTIVIGLTLIIYEAIQQYASLPIYHEGIDRVGSDVIPQIMLFVKRFLNGTFPYLPMPFPEMKYVLIPTYLPLQWMPYIPAEIFGFDYRFVALTICIISICIYLFYSYKAFLPPILKYIIILLPIFYLYQYTISNASGIKITVENNVASYYLLLGIALFRKHIWGIGLMLLACILSRYSLVLWLPLLGILGWHYLEKKAFYKVVIIVLVGVLVLYGPYFLIDPLLFKKGYEYYATASINEWTIQTWQEPDQKYPFHFNFGLGFAHYVYEYINGTVQYKIAFYQKLHIILCILTTSLLGIFSWRNRKYFDFSVLSIATLKIYLSVFYSFVVIPYSYLYVLPNLFSFAVLITLVYLYHQPSNLGKLSDN